MTQQPTTDDSWTDAEARQLVRTLCTGRRTRMASAHDAPSRRAVLARTVETEVIPRLLTVRRPQPAHAAPQRAPIAASRPTGDQVAHLVTTVLEGSQDEAIAYVDAMREGGTPLDWLLLDLLAPAARRLGQMWEDDTCSFSDVTIGLLRLGNVMRLLGGDDTPLRAGPSALLVQVPGEQHGFGVAMVGQFFRSAGWRVCQEPVPTSADLVRAVERQWFGIVGLSVGCSDRLDGLAADIRTIRRHSRNRSVGVMVGGPPFLAHPQLAAMVGADATAKDGKQAVQRAQSLLSLRARDR